MDASQYKVLEFEIPADDFDPNFTPEDGIQYLQQMFHERQRCPAVVTKPFAVAATSASTATTTTTRTASGMPTPEWSNLNPNSTAPEPAAAAATQPSHAELPDIHRSTDEWKHYQHTEFTKMRDYVGQTRAKFGPPEAQPARPAVPAIEDSRGWRRFMLHNQPLLTILLRFTQPQLEQLLDYQLEWLVHGAGGDDEVEDELDADDGGDEFVSVDSTATAAADGQTAIARWDLQRLAAVGRWIYSLMTCFHWPLEPAAHAQLRDVARQALHIRNRLPGGELGANLAAPLNLIVCIVARNFGQADLEERG